MTTIHRRSFFGPGLTQFASALLVCAGLLLLPEPVSSDHDELREKLAPVCGASADTPQDHQWTTGAAVNAPDSCDDEDDDDEGDDDSSGSSGQAIAATQRISANHNDALRLVHAERDAHTFHPLDAHSLRGPPAGQKESSDADVDDDDDDDNVGAHHAAPRAAADRKPHALSSVDTFHPASTGSSQALRAPPQ